MEKLVTNRLTYYLEKKKINKCSDWFRRGKGTTDHNIRSQDAINKYTILLRIHLGSFYTLSISIWHGMASDYIVNLKRWE